jgi:hypothetical protein
MGIYLGNIGNIELTRKSLEGSKESIVNPSDVNADRNRFSFDFDPSFLISGDLVELSTTDGTDLILLTLLAGTTAPYNPAETGTPLLTN